MLAPDDERKFSARHQLGRDPANLAHDLVHARERKVHLRQRVDADAVDVGLRLLVPQLHMRRRAEDLVGADARRISWGPLRVPGTYDVVRSSGIGRTTTRAPAKSAVDGVVPRNSP